MWRIYKTFSKDAVEESICRRQDCFFAGGTGHPYFSTDTATVLRAVEIEAEAILLAKAVDGIYDSDPKTNPNAEKYDEISIEEVVDKETGGNGSDCIDHVYGAEDADAGIWT